jgi:predicted MPP superfamily phosphohydrolase
MFVRVLLRFLAGLGVLALGVAAWGFWLEPSSLRTAEYTLTLPHWPAACSGLRVVALSDFHVGSPWNGLANLHRVVARANAAKPDLVLLLGDFVQGAHRNATVMPEPIAAELGQLEAPLGVYAVLGNHDWWFAAGRVRGALEVEGIPVLEDRAVRLERGECAFWLAGIGDFWETPHDVAHALAEVPADAPLLVATHNPDLFPELPERISLTLAGHTHGGQVWLPFFGRPIVPSRYGQRFAIGHIVEDGRHLFVTPGIGTSIVPVRFLVPPEVSVLELDAGP